MPDSDKAKKLAAAKKKLKAYQSSAASNTPANNDIVKSDISLKNESNDEKDTIVSNNTTIIQNSCKDTSLTSAMQVENVFNMQNINNSNSQLPSLQNYFENNSNSILSFFGQHHPIQLEQNIIDKEVLQDYNPPSSIIPQPEKNLSSFVAKNEYFGDKIIPSVNLEKPENIKTIEILIAEKSNLSTELTKYQTLYKEKVFEIEELHIRLQSSKNQIEDLEKHFFIEQKKVIELQTNLINFADEKRDEKSDVNDLNEHLNELKHELAIERNKNLDLEHQIREKNNQLELNAIRINQISDETSITIDNRIEKLTQTKFMYEQQIIDLQAIVQQLRAEKESANQQYQSYVQHLNKDISAISEKNSELMDENSKLKFRENDLIHHIGGLEKQIQLNIARNESLRDIQKNATTEIDIQKIKEIEEKVNILESLKISLEQENVKISTEAVENKKILELRLEKIGELEERLENILSDRPDDSKLLAQIESDKVAASRAMIQNADLRKQLDELQLKLIDLVNDKAELTNKLDSEIHANKEIRSNYDNFDQQIKSLTEKLHYKDEEMIRLSHENVLLIEKLNNTNSNKTIQINCSEHEQHDHDHELGDRHPHGDSESTALINGNFNNYDLNGENQTIEMAKEVHGSSRKSSASTILPTNEAMQKLEERFTRLMTEVADLTDEKQRLEHLVLQLQGETETIGEYIALYQTQRRQLKQKEIEKDTQLHRLKAEREELKDKLSKLNNLVGKLGLNPDSINIDLKDLPKANLTNGNDNENILSTSTIINPNNAESKKIIDQIHSLITEIKDKEDSLFNSTIVDHCACCQGSLETI